MASGSPRSTRGILKIFLSFPQASERHGSCIRPWGLITSAFPCCRMTVHPVGPKDRYTAAFVITLYPGPSPDGKSCIQTDGQGHYWLQSLEGASVRELTGIAPGEKIINWHGDSDNVFLAHPDGIDVQIYHLNLTTGKRQLWTIFSPQDKTALAGHSIVYITPDGAHFAYQAQRVYSTVFIAKGLR